MTTPANTRRLAAVVLGVGAVLGAAWYLFFGERGDPRLAAFVLAKPTVPVVFTSRTEVASFRAAASVGDYAGTALTGSGQPQWQAREGRLRVLTPSGAVRELTWGRTLPDGGTLIDVMSPSVTADGRTVVFAGRRPGADGGRFRIYSARLSGGELRQLTGGPDDPGCVTVPPLRFGDDGSRLPEDIRRRTDYDDVDPVLLPNGVLVFASSRLPDLGGRDRRATQLWAREPGQPARPMTASRANDRWPFVTVDYRLLFSLWSRQDEVVSAGGTGLARSDPPAAGLTSPVDTWLGAQVSPSSENFAAAVKVPEPVWRPRPLFRGGVAFMTPTPGRPVPFTPANETPETGPLRVGWSPDGQVSAAPSSLAAGRSFPEQDEPHVRWAPATTADGRTWSLATPSPLPPNLVAVSAAPLTPASGDQLTPGGYGLYTLSESGWSPDPAAVGELTPLFDDPDFVDAEPVAVYERPVPDGPLRVPQVWGPADPKQLTLATGPYAGPAGELHIEQLWTADTGKFPGQTVRGGGGPAVPFFPRGSIDRLVFYAAHRDRFDDPTAPVVRGRLEKLHEATTNKAGNGSLRVTLPVGAPTLLVGLGPDGKVASVDGAADAKGNRGKFYAFAGDHVSGTRAGGYHFCTGCHAGHTFPGPSSPERRK